MENSILKIFGSVDVKINPDFCSQINYPTHNSIKLDVKCQTKSSTKTSNQIKYLKKICPTKYLTKPGLISDSELNLHFVSYMLSF